MRCLYYAKNTSRRNIVRKYKESAYDEIINTVDDYCRKYHKNTSIRFALGFYYLFLTKADRESEDYYEDLHMVIFK